jgi:hypothetical protein
MTDTFNQDDDQGPRQVTLPRKAIRKLEKEAAAGREALAKLEQIESRNAFSAAGVPMDSPAADYFVRGYQGERTAEAIKAEWDKSFGSVPQGQQQQVQSEQQQQINEEVLFIEQGADLMAKLDIPTDRLAERNEKLAALDQRDPRLGEKFDAIALEYGTVYGHMQ